MRNKIFLLILLVSVFVVAGVRAQDKTAASSKAKVISAGVLNGKAQSLPKPPYPSAAMAVKASGAVNVQVTIDEEGNVISATAVSGHPLLRSSAVEAAKQAKFSPTLLSGQPVKVTGVIVYNFVNFVPANEPANYEERLKMLALGAFLAMAHVDEFIKDEELVRDFPGELAEFSAELAPLKNLNTLSPPEREAVLERIYQAVKVRLNGAEANELEIGRLFGGILVEVGKAQREKGYQVNESLIKDHLVKLKSLLAASSNFPEPVMEQFILLTEMAEKPNLSSQDNLIGMAYRIMRIIESVSPESFK